MTPLVVLPVLDATAARECIATMAPELVAALLVVENGMTRIGATGAGQGHYCPPPHRARRYRPHRNLGVSRTINYSLDRMDAAGCDTLVWVSTTMRFGDDGGRRLLTAAEGAELGVVAQAPVAWHAVAMKRQAFDLAGRWDENFLPAYYEDTDWRRRLCLATGLPDPLPQVDIGGHAHDGHGYDVLRRANPGRQVINFDALKEFYIQKWGAVPPHGPETLALPWGDRPLDYWPPATREELIARYGLGVA